jgi:hypothetical protein
MIPEVGDGGADEELLDETHARVWRHFERAEFEEPEAAAGGIRGEELVDAEFGAVGISGEVCEEVAEDAVDEPWGDVRVVGDLAEGDFEFVEDVVAGFVDARVLTGGADEETAEEIGEGWVAEPEAEKRAEEVGAAEERGVGRGGSTHDDVVAAAGAGVAAVEHEFFGAETELAGVVVDAFGGGDEFVP